MPGIPIAIVGEQNSGKSFSQQFLKGEECFALCPSIKSRNLRLKDKSPVKALNIFTKDKTMKDLMAKVGANSTDSFIRKVCGKVLPDTTKIEGNWAFLKDIKFVEYYVRFIATNMPHVKYVFVQDFSHYLSRILASRVFMDRNTGGEAFARFWDLAADSLNNTVLAIEQLERDFIVIFEFHVDKRAGRPHGFFVPAGNMLTEKFKLESYFDFVFETYVDPEEVDARGVVKSSAYKFVTQKAFINGSESAARSKGLFEPFISNDLSKILPVIAKDFGISL